MELIDPKFSFLQFNSPFDTIPVVEEGDLKFQVRLEADSEVEADELENGGSVNIYLVKPTGLIQSPVSLLGNVLLDYDNLYSMQPGLIRTGPKTFVVYWERGVYGFQNVINIGECFRITIVVAYQVRKKIYATSNLLHRLGSAKYTSTLEYWCDEDAYDFQYCGGYMPNKFRLPLHINRPQIQSEDSVYVRSDGSRKLLKSVSKKEYAGAVEMLTEGWHERIQSALSHDHINIASKHYTGGIVRSAAYEIEWPDFMDFEASPAKFKVLATPYNWRNSNCAACKPWSRNGGGPGGDGGVIGCPAPTNILVTDITAFRARLNWTVINDPNVTAVEIILFEAQTPATPLQGYPVTVPASPGQYTFSGLASNTDYQCFIKTKCINNISTPWQATGNDPSFTTLP